MLKQILNDFFMQHAKFQWNLTDTYKIWLLQLQSLSKKFCESHGKFFKHFSQSTLSQTCYADNFFIQRDFFFILIPKRLIVEHMSVII